jgi:hypothetical protein
LIYNTGGKNNPKVSVWSDWLYVQPVTDGMRIDSFYPIINDICKEEDNTLTIRGVGFSMPLHVYIDGVEHSSSNITVSSGGDYIYDVIVPELDRGFHTVVVFTDDGKMASAQYEWYDSRIDCLPEYASRLQGLASCSDVVSPPSLGSSNPNSNTPSTPSPSPSTTLDSGQILSIGDIGKLSETRQYEIVRLAKLGITAGCEVISETDKIKKIKFCPTNPVNRGSMAEFLYKTNIQLNTSIYDQSLEGLDEDIYPDISKLSVNRRLSILWLAKHRITLGAGTNAKGETVYKPTSSVNRGAMAQFLFKLAGADPSYQDYTPNFKDIKSLTPERIRAINWMGMTGITKGSGSPNTYKPNDVVNRGSMAEFIMRFIEYKNK